MTRLPNIEPSLPQCARCRNRLGPFKPSGERYRSGAQVLVCAGGCPPATSRCTAAHPEDPTLCQGAQNAVRVVDQAGTETVGCCHHGARLYASLERPRVYPMPGHDGAALDVYYRAQNLPPFPWTTEPPGHP